MAELSLAGATVCVTGLGKGERAYVQHVTQLVCARPPRCRVSTHPTTQAALSSCSQAGGVYSRELHKGCTQLVVADRATATPKVRGTLLWAVDFEYTGYSGAPHSACS